MPPYSKKNTYSTFFMEVFLHFKCLGNHHKKKSESIENKEDVCAWVKILTLWFLVAGYIFQVIGGEESGLDLVGVL